MTEKTISTNTGNSIDKILSYIKWILVIIIGLSPIIGSLDPKLSFFYLFSFLFLFVFTCIHGTQRYGVKNMIFWFFLTWLVSNGLEWLSITTGFPFGNYHYNQAGPRFLDVPLNIMPTYFGLAYMSWSVAQVVTNRFAKRLSGLYLFIIPFITSLVMTMWDLVTDSQSSVIQENWTWEDGGVFYGVPVSNFAGWVFTIFIFMQIFSLYISKKNQDISTNQVTEKKSFWLQPVLIYLCLGISVVIGGFTQSQNTEIHMSMALIACFSMVFTAIISLLSIHQAKDLI